MQIDKSNYEIWVIDWLDGKLDEEQAGQLFQFFKENPDLMEESEDFGILKVLPAEETFQSKKSLQKTPSDITGSQFDFLCAAYLENDLNDVQLLELEESITGNPGKSESFELFRKLKLVPLDITYKGKERLIRKTFAQKVIRLSYIGLTAAAVILFAVLTFVLRQPSLPVQTKIAEATSTEKKIPAATNNSANENHITTTGKPLQNKIIKKDIHEDQTLIDDKNRESLNDDRFTIEKIKIAPEIALLPESLPDKLVAYNPEPVIVIIDEDNTRTKVGKFLSKTFRQRILREETSEDTPLKAYEIAEAGVTGLNKILGWQMALEEKTDDAGNPKSVYFSSKILKINAPVKKSEVGK